MTLFKHLVLLAFPAFGESLQGEPQLPGFLPTSGATLHVVWVVLPLHSLYIYVLVSLGSVVDSVPLYGMMPTTPRISCATKDRAPVIVYRSDSSPDCLLISYVYLDLVGILGHFQTAAPPSK